MSIFLLFLAWISTQGGFTIFHLCYTPFTSGSTLSYSKWNLTNCYGFLLEKQLVSHHVAAILNSTHHQLCLGLTNFIFFFCKNCLVLKLVLIENHYFTYTYNIFCTKLSRYIRLNMNFVTYFWTIFPVKNSTVITVWLK